MPAICTWADPSDLDDSVDPHAVGYVTEIVDGGYQVLWSDDFTIHHAPYDTVVPTDR